jgi:hypothetical protein
MMANIAETHIVKGKGNHLFYIDPWTKDHNGVWMKKKRIRLL